MWIIEKNGDNDKLTEVHPASRGVRCCMFLVLVGSKNGGIYIDTDLGPVQRKYF